jgi:hypothetical protein
VCEAVFPQKFIYKTDGGWVSCGLTLDRKYQHSTVLIEFFFLKPSCPKHQTIYQVNSTHGISLKERQLLMHSPTSSLSKTFGENGISM